MGRLVEQQDSVRRLVHRALNDADMTRADLARQMGVDVHKLNRALDWPEYLTVEGIARICTAPEITLTFSEKHASSGHSRLVNKQLRRGNR